MSTTVVPGGGEFGRSARREVRNPILALPAARLILGLAPSQRRPLGILLRQLAGQCDGQAQEAWAKRKGIMAAYWRAVATYSKHLARVIDPRTAARREADALVVNLRNTTETECRCAPDGVVALCRAAATELDALRGVLAADGSGLAELAEADAVIARNFPNATAATVQPDTWRAIERHRIGLGQLLRLLKGPGSCRSRRWMKCRRVGKR